MPNTQVKDKRVLKVLPLVNTILTTNTHVTDEIKEELKEFPKLIELLEYTEKVLKPRNITKIYVSFATNDTVDSVCDELMKLHTILDERQE